MTWQRPLTREGLHASFHADGRRCVGDHRAWCAGLGGRHPGSSARGRCRHHGRNHPRLLAWGLRPSALRMAPRLRPLALPLLASGLTGTIAIGITATGTADGGTIVEDWSGTVSVLARECAAVAHLHIDASSPARDPQVWTRYHTTRSSRPDVKFGWEVAIHGNDSYIVEKRHRFIRSPQKANRPACRVATLSRGQRHLERSKRDQP